MNQKENKTVVTRIPPSPTGNLNIGSARTALFNYVYAKKYGGKIVFRSEDTDLARSKKEYEDNILEGLTWLGISWDEFYRQTDRADIYKKYLSEMIEKDLAYISEEEPSEEGKRGEVIRFRNTNESITFHDEVRGDITFDTTELGDFVIAKSLDEALYHLAVVVDDHEMGVTHVIRGEDGISNTPRQILIQRAIGAAQPVYAHLPLVLNDQKKKLSKRDGVKSISEYKKDGYFPDAIVNYLALIGWNPGTDQEIFTLDELVEAFDFTGVQKAGAIYDEKKLLSINGQHLKKVSDDVVKENISQYLSDIPEDRLTKLIPVIKERLDVYKQVQEQKGAGEFDYYISEPDIDAADLHWKKIEDEKLTAKHLEFIISKVSEVDEIASPESIKEKIWDYADDNGKGDVLWPMRFSLSGVQKSPDPFTLAYILGKETTLNRLQFALEKVI